MRRSMRYTCCVCCCMYICCLLLAIAADLPFTIRRQWVVHRRGQSLFLVTWEIKGSIHADYRQCIGSVDWSMEHVFVMFNRIFFCFILLYYWPWYALLKWFYSFNIFHLISVNTLLQSFEQEEGDATDCDLKQEQSIPDRHRLIMCWWICRFQFFHFDMGTDQGIFSWGPGIILISGFVRAFLSGVSDVEDFNRPVDNFFLYFVWDKKKAQKYSHTPSQISLLLSQVSAGICSHTHRELVVFRQHETNQGRLLSSLHLKFWTFWTANIDSRHDHAACQRHAGSLPRVHLAQQ